MVMNPLYLYFWLLFVSQNILCWTYFRVSICSAGMFSASNQFRPPTSPFPSPQWRERRHLLCRRWAEFWCFGLMDPTSQTTMLKTGSKLCVWYFSFNNVVWVIGSECYCFWVSFLALPWLWLGWRGGGGSGQNTTFMYDICHIVYNLHILFLYYNNPPHAMWFAGLSSAHFVQHIN